MIKRGLAQLEELVVLEEEQDANNKPNGKDDEPPKPKDDAGRDE